MFEAFRDAHWRADAERLGGGGGGELGMGVEDEGGDWDDGAVAGLVTLTEDVPARLLDLSQSAMPCDALSSHRIAVLR